MESFDLERVFGIVEFRHYVMRIAMGERGAEVGLRRVLTGPLRAIVLMTTYESSSYVDRLVRETLREMIGLIRYNEIRSTSQATMFLRNSLGLGQAPRKAPVVSGGLPPVARRAVAKKAASRKPTASFQEARKAHPNPVKARPGIIFPILFGTDRKPVDSKAAFGNERGDDVTVGEIKVFVPESHKFGELGTSFIGRLRRGELKSDKLVVTEIKPVETDKFWAHLARSMDAALTRDASSHALVFIHGFNVSFDEAARRTAQIGVDLKINGPTAFFSWPSRGDLLSYMADEATIDGSVLALQAFLERFLEMCGTENVNVIAHSMGNRALLRVLQEFGTQAERVGKRFGQIILAAPDIDQKLFIQLASAYSRYSMRTTLYASKHDRALSTSKKLHQYPRAGYYEPYTVVAGIDSIAVQGFPVDWLGHSYFAEAEALLHDIYTLFRSNTDPAHRQRVHELISGKLKLWRLS